MEFEDREEEQEEETGMSPNYENQSRTKMPSPVALDSVQPPPSMAPALKPRYRECLKNHAVGLGGHAVDGCCEFLAAGPDGTLDALKCAACNCHRNFHKKETITDQQVPGSELNIGRVHSSPAQQSKDILIVIHYLSI